MRSLFSKDAENPIFNICHYVLLSQALSLQVALYLILLQKKDNFFQSLNQVFWQATTKAK